VYCFDSDAVNPNPLARLRSLAALKKSLQEHLAAVEAMERSTHEDLEPKTRAQFERIETDLQAALDEVRVQKAALQPAPRKKVRGRARG
jgi:hypothetical protein